MKFRTVITTSDAYVHLCRGFARQWNKYCGLPVTLVWRNVEPPPLPDNFTLLHSPARWHDWSGSLIGALQQMDDEIILLGLEDFWLSGPADLDYLNAAAWLIQGSPEVARIDLTDDRTAYPYVKKGGYYEAVVDPEQTTIQYLCSTQFSLWRREFLLHALVPGELSPHFEVEGSRRVAPDNPVILGAGFRPLPCSGDGVVWNGRLDQLHTDYLPAADVAELKAEGLL